MKTTIGNCELWLGDAYEILPAIGKVDLVIADPPYELSIADCEPRKSNGIGSFKKMESINFADIITGFDHEKMFILLEEKAAPFNLFCFCSNRQISKIMRHHEDKGRIVTMLVWHKVNAAPFANGVWRGDIEYCIHARDKGAVFEGGAMEKKKVFEHGTVSDADHPTVKPLSLIRKYIAIGSLPGQIVLDPMMGSGTTGSACAKMGRKFIGIEKDERYYTIACERIENAYRQPDMLDVPMRQEAMI